MINKSDIKIGLVMYHAGDTNHIKPYTIVAITPLGNAIVSWKNEKNDLKEAMIFDEALSHYSVEKIERKGYINLTRLNNTKTISASKVYDTFKEAVDNRVQMSTIIYIDTIPISWKE